MAREVKSVTYCVKVSIWENGLMKKVLSKDIFTKEIDAERFYNECDEEGTVVQLSKDIGGETLIKMKKL